MADEYMFSDVNLGGGGDSLNDASYNTLLNLGTELSYLGGPGSYESQLLLSTYEPEELQSVAQAYFAANPDLSEADKKAIENYIVAGVSPEEMGELSKQAGADVAPGGIMSGNPFGTKTGGTRPQTFLEKLGIGAGSDGKGILGTGISGTDAAKYAAMLAMAKLAYNDAQRAREEAKGKPFKSSSGYQTVTGAGGVTGFKKAAIGGGIGSLDMARGGRTLPPRYLDGHSDGMADKVPANIDGKRPAALSDGEFVIPADVVSHIGNGNSNAGAKRLYKMMDDIRAARTGNPKQGKQINPDKFMPR